MKMIKNIKANRDMEQDKRYLTFQRDRESLEVSKLESDIDDEKYRVDNFLTNGVYFITLNGKEFKCDCPDFTGKCAELKIRCKHILAVENWKARGEKVRVKKEKFEPKKHLIKVKGKDYLEVKFRLHWFRQEKALWDIRTEVVKLDLERGIAAVRSDIYDEKGIHKSSGMSLEREGNFADYLEKAETSATGRALAALGYGTLQSSELDEGKFVDAPVSSGGNNGSNGKVKVLTCAGNNGNGKTKGNNGKAEEYKDGPKASLRQVRYIKNLCKDLGEKPRIDVAGLTMENASMIIEGLQKELQERRKK